MRRLAALADIHGNLPALRAVVADLERRGIQTVLNLGDHASGPLWPRETVMLLMQQRWAQIAGNTDRQLVRDDPSTHGASDQYAFANLSPAQRYWLQALPATIQHAPDLLLCHGTPASDSRYLLETVAYGTVQLAPRAEIAQRLGEITAGVVLCGHSHVPRAVHVTASLLAVNPGSVGLPAYEHTEPEPHAVETGSPLARYAILEQHGGAWAVEFVALAYDHLSAANQSRRNGRPDWEIALRTGYLHH